MRGHDYQIQQVTHDSSALSTPDATVHSLRVFADDDAVKVDFALRAKKSAASGGS
jgi:hypothetical protein